MFSIGLPYSSNLTGPRGASERSTRRSEAMSFSPFSTSPPVASSAAFSMMPATEPGDVGGVVGSVEWRPELLDDLAAGLLVGPLEAGRDLPAEGEVVADHGHPLVAEVVVDPFAERVRRLRARPARAHDPRAALALREVIGGHDRMDGRDLLL